MIEDIRFIKLTQGKFAIVDAKNAERLSKLKWHVHVKREGSGMYAIHTVRLCKDRYASIKMHNAILKPSPGCNVDHRNHYGLDNREENLRLASNGQNRTNSRKLRKSTSRYKGVSWHKKTGKWIAYIVIMAAGKRAQIYLGLFTGEADAARAYDLAARSLYGEFANPNFPNVEEVTSSVAICG